ncbi:MAG: NAD(P)-dependent oxidoreductase [Chitinophagaceae bacterium]|nr:NAD(P)-dependent oxidoreductase [Chitinophagaceae bacterium]
MTVLVTGASGFVGRHVIKFLSQFDVFIIATTTNIGKLEKFQWPINVQYVEYNLRSPLDQLIDQIGVPDALIHLAWQGLPNYKQQFHELEELPFQQQFLKQMIALGCCNITVTGTCMEYGMQEGCLTEEMEVFPQTSYAKAKNSLRCYLEDLQKDYEFSLKWLRLFYMYGEGQNPTSIIPALQRALDEGQPQFNMSLGDQERDFLHIDHIAEYICLASLQTKIQGIINISSGKPITVLSLVQHYLEQRKQNISLNLGFYPKPDYEPQSFWGNNSKLKKIIHESNRRV